MGSEGEDVCLLPLKACVDASYTERESVAACVLFDDWSDGRGRTEIVRHLPPAPPYLPGEFHLRELPCLLAVLAESVCPIELVLVDGHAWLAEGRPGLGARLHVALGGRVPVIGVAKRPYRGGTDEAVTARVLRGGSSAPLFVSAAGLPLEEAARRVAGMHGRHRVPTLLRRADRLCREG